MRPRALTIAERVSALENRLDRIEADIGPAGPPPWGRGLHTVKELRRILRFPSDEACRT